MSELESKQNDSKSSDPAKGSFYDELALFLRREDLIQFFRLTNKGVFLQEDAFEMLFSAYQKWQQKKRGESEVLSVEKIRKRLLGVDPLPLQYLVEGKKCLVGYLLPNSIPPPGGGKGIPSTGTLFQPSSYLDARDPIFQSTEGVLLRNTPKDGVLIEFRTKKQMFDCGTDAVKQFAEVCRHSPQLMKEFPETKETLRGCLAPLRHIFERARPIGKSSPLLVPSELMKQETSFVQYKNLVLAMRGSRFLLCYERKGRGEAQLLRGEIQKISGKAEAPDTIRGFTPNHEKGFQLGKIWVRGMSFLLHPNALMQFIRMFPRCNGRTKLKPHFSLQQILLQLVPAFFRSQALGDDDARKLPMRYRESGAKYRRFADWVFVITDKNTIRSCFLYRTEKQRSRPAGRGKPPAQDIPKAGIPKVAQPPEKEPG